jgi:hypothetical protein
MILLWVTVIGIDRLRVILIASLCPCLPSRNWRLLTVRLINCSAYSSILLALPLIAHKCLRYCKWLEHMSQLGKRISRYVQSEPKYRQDGCLLVATYPRLDRLHREWEVQERKLQTILTRIDVDVAQIQNPGMTRQSAKVMIGLGPRLYLKKEYY